MRFRWSVAPPQPILAARLSTDLRIPALLAQCLLNRGLADGGSMQSFLQPRLKQLADPFLLPDMEKAVARLFQARERGEKTVIFGDYDVDGVTSVALLLEVLRPLGWDVEYYLPNRMDEGYGLTTEAIEHCLQKHQAKLLLAVDCGSTAVDAIGALRSRGTDVIVLDHHQVSIPQPAANALVNPQSQASAQREGSGPLCHPPFSELCSVGIAFKLAHALVKRGRQTSMPEAMGFDIRLLLDLVALGTIADIVPLTGENRILVSKGLQRLSNTTRPGLVALIRVARSSLPVGAYEVGFQLGPRLNAAGRLESAEQSLRLLLSRDHAEALRLAGDLDACNRERQELERRIAEEAVAAVRARFKPEDDFVIVQGNLLWHIGVVGIVASRLQQQFYRPSIVVGGDGDKWRGSGRSIAGFDLASALRECSDLLVRHGGHSMAAGVTIAPEKLDAFRERLNQVAMRTLTPEQLLPPLLLDGEVTFRDLTHGCVAQLAKLAPTGQGNPAAQFCARKLAHCRPPQRLGTEKQHVKMFVTDGTGAQEVVWWGVGDALLPTDRFDLAFAPQINTYQGRQSVQLKLLDWQTSEGMDSAKRV
jgi:single-stranded-DNA-specific exonuclease